MTDQNSDSYQTATDEEDAVDDEDEQVHEMTNSSWFEYPSRTPGTNNMKDFLTYRGSSNSSILSSPPNSGDIEGLDDTDMSCERFFSSGAERNETEVMSQPSARQIVIKGRKVEQKTTSLSRQHSGVDRAEMTIEPTKQKVISKQTSMTMSSSSTSVTPEFLEESRKRAAAAFNGPKARIVNIPIQNVKSSQVVNVKSQVVEAKVRDFFESIKETLIDPERDLMKSFMNESNIEDMSMFSRKHDVLSHAEESNAALQHSMQPAATAVPIPATRGKDMRRSKTNPKSNMETLKRIGKYQTLDRPSPDVKISDAQIEYLQQNYEKHEVVLRKEEGGFGLTLTGNGPVSVNYVKPDGIAFKNKVCVGDIIFKINGDLVVKKSHAEVVALVQKAGKDIALTLLRNQTNEPLPLTPIFKGEEMDVVSKPMVVAKEKDLELKESTVQTIRSMYDSAVQELDALKADYQWNQNEDLSQKIENKLKVVSRLEAKLSNLTGVPIQPNSSASFRRTVQPGALVTERRRQNSKDNTPEQQTLSPPVPDLGRGMISPMIAEQPPKPVKPDIISLDMSDEDEIPGDQFRRFPGERN